MLVYLALLIVVVITALMGRSARSRTERNLFLFLGFASMVLVAGLRDQTVGTDTTNYVAQYRDISSFSDAVTYMLHGEQAFWALNWLLHLVSDDYMALLFGIAAITIACYQWSMAKYSAHLGISSFVFITMGFYTFFLNGARQGMACAIYSLAIGPLFNRQFGRYFLIVLLAFFFHKTAVIALPVYFLFNKKTSLKTTLLMVLTGCLGVVLLRPIVELSSRYDTRYSTYATSGEGGGYLVVGSICALCLFFMYYKKMVQEDREQYSLFLNMLIFGAVISLVPVILRVNPSGILRLNMYFNISIVFLWPIVYKNLRGRHARILFNYSFMLIYLTYFVLTTQRFSNLVPYIFNPALPL